MLMSGWKVAIPVKDHIDLDKQPIENRCNFAYADGHVKTEEPYRKTEKEWRAR